MNKLIKEWTNEWSPLARSNRWQTKVRCWAIMSLWNTLFSKSLELYHRHEPYYSFSGCQCTIRVEFWWLWRPYDLCHFHIQWLFLIRGQMSSNHEVKFLKKHNSDPGFFFLSPVSNTECRFSGYWFWIPCCSSLENQSMTDIQTSELTIIQSDWIIRESCKHPVFQCSCLIVENNNTWHDHKVQTTVFIILINITTADRLSNYSS